jgi:hypothetical protein
LGGTDRRGGTDGGGRNRSAGLTRCPASMWANDTDWLTADKFIGGQRDS